MFDAFLVGWRLEVGMDGSIRFGGKIYGDSKGRFSDGELVWSSPMYAVEHGEAGSILVTKSGTRYLLCATEPKDVG